MVVDMPAKCIYIGVVDWQFFGRRGVTLFDIISNHKFVRHFSAPASNQHVTIKSQKNKEYLQASSIQ